MMTPTGFVVVHGCVLWPEDDPPSDEEIRTRLDRFESSSRSLSVPPELAVSRARAAVEHEYNRRFVQSELEHVGIDGVTPEDLVTCAELWAAILRDALHRHDADRSFVVEIVGADAAGDEPLEVCVTFHRALPS